MNTVRPIVLGIAAVLLAACVATEPTREQIRADGLGNVALPGTWANRTDGTAVGSAWLRSFNDPELEALVASALEHNPDLTIAAARLEQADAQVDLAEARLKPAIGLLLRGGAKPISDLVATLSGVMLRLVWEVDLWGRLRYARNAAIAERDATGADLQFARQSIAASVARAWFLAAETAQQQVLAERMANEASKFVDLTDQRWRVGAGTETDVLVARTNLANYRDAAQQVALAHRQALRALELLAGRYPSATLQARTELAAFPGPAPAGVPLDMLNRRPDLFAAERRVAAAFDLVGEANRAFFPNVSISAGYGRISRNAEQLEGLSDATTASGSVTAVVPLYAGGALTGQVALRTAQQREALADYTRRALKALDEVEDALNAEQTLSAREDILQSAATDSRRATGLEETAYRIGKSDLRAVVQRQLAANATEVALLAVRRERLVRRVDLHLALGGDFLPPPAEGDAVGAR
jgi:NodT family efflux transporter outer membrane factor (OMF) lipoprotein